jgi:hypothetical protein
MQTTLDDQEVLVRGSEEHKSYLWFKHGWIKAIVNYLEEYLSITGRLMLLAYIVYIAVQAGMQNFLHVSTPPLLDIVMLAIQVAGLEGSIPGLIHTAEDLDERGKIESAKTVRRSARNAQYLAIMTIVDLFFMAVNDHAVSAARTLDPRVVTAVGVLAFLYSWFLLGCRVYVIGNYLISMAHITRRDLRVISQAEANKHQNTPVNLPDYSQMIDDLNAEVGQKLIEIEHNLPSVIFAELQQTLITFRSEMSAQIDAKIGQPEPLDYSEIVNKLMPVLSQFHASLQEEISAQTPTIEPLDYVAIIDHMMPTLSDWRGDIVAQMSAKLDDVNARIPELMSMDELALQIAPLLSSASTLERTEDELLDAPSDGPIDLESRRITRVLNDLVEDQENDHSNDHRVDHENAQRDTTPLVPTRITRRAQPGSNETLKKVRRLVKRNEQITPDQIAQKVQISPSYARKLKAKVLAEQPA